MWWVLSVNFSCDVGSWLLPLIMLRYVTSVDDFLDFKLELSALIYGVPMVLVELSILVLVLSGCISLSLLGAANGIFPLDLYKDLTRRDQESESSRS